MREMKRREHSIAMWGGEFEGILIACLVSAFFVGESSQSHYWVLLNPAKC